jgi:hypothetical protein
MIFYELFIFHIFVFSYLLIFFDGWNGTGFSGGAALAEPVMLQEKEKEA